MPYPFKGKRKKIEKGIVYATPELPVTDAPQIQLQYGPKGEKLDNPEFLPQYHKDPSYDYFNLRFPTWSPRESRISQITKYLHAFINLDSTKENLKVDFVKINNKNVLNRVKGEYFNLSNKMTKEYFFDVDFLPEKVSMASFTSAAHKIYLGLARDPYYGKCYKITRNADCKAIRKQLKNPKFFICTPMVTDMGFIPPTTYSVDAVLKGKMFRGQLFQTKTFSTALADPLIPDRNEKPKTEEPSLLSFVLERVNNIKSKDKDREYKGYMMKALTTKEFVARIGKFDEVVGQFSEVYVKSRGNVEDDAQVKLKSLLWDRRRDEFNQEKEDMLNYNIMTDLAEQINKYQLNNAIKKTKNSLRNLGDLKTYLVRRKRFATEIQIQRVYEYLDYLRFLKDERIEKKFLNGFSDD